MDFLKIGKEPLDVVERVRPFGVTGEEHPLPCGMLRTSAGSCFGVHRKQFNNESPASLSRCGCYSALGEPEDLLRMQDDL